MQRKLDEKQKSNINIVICMLLLIPASIMICHVSTNSFDKNVFFWNTILTGSCIGVVLIVAVFNRRLLHTLPLMIGFVFAIIGDSFMTLGRGFIYGVLWFFVAHICYIIYYFFNADLHKKNLIWIFATVLVAVFVPYMLYYFFMLYGKIDDIITKFGVLLYIIASVVAFASAFVNNFKLPFKIIAILGIGFIAFSDTLISMSSFLGVNNVSKYIIPTYIISHFLMTTATVLDVAKKE